MMRSGVLLSLRTQYSTASLVKTSNMWLKIMHFEFAHHALTLYSI